MNVVGSIDPVKFQDPEITADGSPRARVALQRLETLWFNTGTLCNLTCANCYIESSPTNDRLVYLSNAEAVSYLDEIEELDLGTKQIGLTGGEPFMNPDAISIIETALQRGFEVLVLTNAMKPMMHRRDALIDLKERFGQRLVMRVSLDHHTRDLHERERGPGSWQPAMDGLKFLSATGFTVNVAGRQFTEETEQQCRDAYAALFDREAINVDALDAKALVLFPEMDPAQDVVEITEACWGILDVNSADQMCASSRMVIKRKGAEFPVVVSCTLIPYNQGFELATKLKDALNPVYLNHPFCAQFCVLGGATCSG